MTIIERKKIIEAYERSRSLGGTHEESCASAALALGIDSELVAIVVAEREPA